MHFTALLPLVLVALAATFPAPVAQSDVCGDCRTSLNNAFVPHITTVKNDAGTLCTALSGSEKLTSSHVTCSFCLVFS
jgi:hypothetical protein